jgi:hypothetical protein
MSCVGQFRDEEDGGETLYTISIGDCRDGLPMGRDGSQPAGTVTMQRRPPGISPAAAR